MATDTYGPTLLALSQFSTFNAFLPKLSEVRNATPDDPVLLADIRQGEVVASGISLTIAATASAMQGTALPLLVCLLVCAAMVALYEYTLWNSPFGPNKIQTEKEQAA